MAILNEEDYLDNLLKSFTEKNDSNISEELYKTDSELTVPETFSNNSVVNVTETSDDDIYSQMLFDKSKNISHAKPQNNEQMTEEELLESIYNNALNNIDSVAAEEEEEEEEISEDEMVEQYIQKVLSEENVDEVTGTEEEYAEEIPATEEEYIKEIPAAEEEYVGEIPAAEEEYIEEMPAVEEEYIEEIPATEEGYEEEIPATEEEYVGEMPAAEEEYIEENSLQEAMQAVEEPVEGESETEVPVEEESSIEVPAQEEEQVEEPVEEENNYIDITNDASESAEDLISMLDDIISDVNEEINEARAAKEALEKEQEALKVKEAAELEASALASVDDEMKELLGLNEDDGNNNADTDTEALSADDLSRLNDMLNEANDSNDADESIAEYGISNFEDEDDNSAIADLLGQLEDNNIELAPPEEQDPALLEIKDISEVKGTKKKSSGGLLDIIKKIFTNKQKNEDASNDSADYESIINQVIDQDGNLRNDDSKPKKKGLFGGMKKITFLSEDEEDDEDDDEIIGKPLKKKEPKPKKEKKQKEEKPKKEKKPKKPKPVKPKKEKKPKEPVNPKEVIKLKPLGILSILVVVAGICGSTYLYVTEFTYNQAVNAAAFYMVNREYDRAYDRIAGIEPKNEEDIAMIEQITIIMRVRRKYSAYMRYLELNMPIEALDSLIMGIGTYYDYYDDAVTLGVDKNIDEIKVMIVQELSKYGISEELAKSFSEITDYDQYMYIIETYGGIANDSNN